MLSMGQEKGVQSTANEISHIITCKSDKPTEQVTYSLVRATSQRNKLYIHLKERQANEISNIFTCKSDRPTRQITYSLERASQPNKSHIHSKEQAD